MNQTTVQHTIYDTLPLVSAILMNGCRFIPMTGPLPGAIAIVQLHGDVCTALRAITGREDWPIGRARLMKFRDIDEGLAVRLDDHVAQLMPHGGPRVMQRMQTLLHELGVDDAQFDEVSAARALS
jgi:tRNA U34 5-carboxymethylaminomethyl modifying GTPase MnmE/TrmE